MRLDTDTLTWPRRSVDRAARSPSFLMLQKDRGTLKKKGGAWKRHGPGEVDSALQ